MYLLIALLILVALAYIYLRYFHKHPPQSALLDALVGVILGSGIVFVWIRWG